MIIPYQLRNMNKNSSPKSENICYFKILCLHQSFGQLFDATYAKLYQVISFYILQRANSSIYQRQKKIDET